MLLSGLECNASVYGTKAVILYLLFFFFFPLDDYSSVAEHEQITPANLQVIFTDESVTANAAQVMQMLSGLTHDECNSEKGTTWTLDFYESSIRNKGSPNFNQISLRR